MHNSILSLNEKEKLLPFFYPDWFWENKNKTNIDRLDVLIELENFGETNPLLDKDIDEISEIIFNLKEKHLNYNKIYFKNFSRNEGSSGNVNYYYLVGKRKETDDEFLLRTSKIKNDQDIFLKMIDNAELPQPNIETANEKLSYVWKNNNGEKFIVTKNKKMLEYSGFFLEEQVSGKLMLTNQIPKNIIYYILKLKVKL